MTPEQTVLFKDVIYPVIDIILKIIAGVILLIYFQGKTQKGASKEKMCDVYFSILDGQDKLHYHYSKSPFLEIFRATPLAKVSEETYEIYNKALDECLGHKYLTSSDAFDTQVSLTTSYRKLYFLMGKKEYMKYFSELRSDVDSYCSSSATGELSQFTLRDKYSKEIADAQRNIKEIAKWREENHLTKGEAKDKMYFELLSVYSKISKDSSDYFQNKIGKHTQKMVEYINWYG
ncbi:hypothetical protein [Idiomarina aquatica]|uniref:Uncharacterized protein n=1 Tax=Idiomarina aquatica TaxID=1327752 RepID=A0AA94EGH5_9GAMM|nr:hypothetical protein [Idiomarina aquatica]RUO44510.1 hypothetical protein CWE23_00220 [Idiomarina aquatica]